MPNAAKKSNSPGSSPKTAFDFLNKVRHINGVTHVSAHNRFAAFHFQDFRLHVVARFLMFSAHLMLTVAVGQHVYQITGDPLKLGYVGLALFVPKFGLTLLAGQTADRFDRRHVMLVCRAVQLIISIALIVLMLKMPSNINFLYVLLFLTGTANAFEGPAGAALVPHLVPHEYIHNAVTWNSSIIQFALVFGPAMGGWIYAWGGSALSVFYAVLIARLVSTLLLFLMQTRTGRLQKVEVSRHTLLAGLHYVWKTKIILGAISLDLFAVLLGGAVALLPVYANDIFKVGPQGLGYLRAAPSIGAATMALLLAGRPPQKKTGPIMFVCVAIFGLATILFGISKSFAAAIVWLVIMGAADMVSVVIRGVLIQSATPSEMRGRVNAVNLVFIGASNELGEFESGLTAALFGTIPSVVIGGIGTILVVVIWSWLFPELRKLERSH